MSLPWYRRFPDNFIAGTVGLTLEEKGAYSLLLDLMYVRGGPVPDEPRYIAGVCNCSVRKWNAIRSRLIELRKIELVNGHLTNHRAEEELENSAKVERERAENGAKGGNKKAENNAVSKENKGLAVATPYHSTTTSTPFKKEGAIASDPTEKLVEVAEGTEDFMALTAYRKGVPPIVGKRFTAFVAPAVLEEARKAYGLTEVAA